MARSKRLRETLDKLAAAEERAFASEFLAPVVRGGTVRLRIAGVVCRPQGLSGRIPRLGHFPAKLTR